MGVFRFLRVFTAVSVLLLMMIGCLLFQPDDAAGAVELSGPPSEAVLRRYLSRAVTMSDLFHGIGDFDEHLLFLQDVGARFVGRVAFVWTEESRLTEEVATAEEIASRSHLLGVRVRCGKHPAVKQLGDLLTIDPIDLHISAVGWSEAQLPARQRIHNRFHGERATKHEGDSQLLV